MVEKQQRAELEALRKASLSLTSSLELETVFEAILEHALKLIQADDAHIFLFDGERLSFGAAMWADGTRGEPYAEPRRDGLTYSVARSGEQIVVPDMRSHPLYETTDWEGSILGLPLRIGKRVLGVMTIAFERLHDFTEDELRVLELFADQAAVAVENARLFERTTHERRNQQLLIDITRELSSTLNRDDILQRAIELTVESLGGMHGGVVIPDPQNGRLSLQSLTGHAGLTVREMDAELQLRIGEGLIGWVAKHREAVRVPDLQSDPRWVISSPRDQFVRSGLMAPILSGSELLGVISVFHAEPDAFEDSHLDLLVAISRQLSLAMKNVERYEQVERQLAEFALLQQMGQVFNQRLEMQPLLDEVVYQVSEVLGYPVVNVDLIEEDELVIKATRGTGHQPTEQEVRMPIDRGVVGRVVRTNRPALVPDVREDPDYVALSPDTLSELAVPLRKREEVIGVLNVESQELNGFDADDLRLLSLLADQVSIALENAALYDRLRQHSTNLEHTVAERTAALAKALDRSREADRMKTQFVSDVSHELRTPLSNILLYLDLLRQGRSERFSTYLETLERETERLINLIEDLLAFSRLDAGTMPVNTSHLNLNDMARNLVEDRKRLFAEREIELRFEPSESLPLVRGDERMLTQVFANLMTNAMHYTPAGGRVSMASRSVQEDDEDWVILMVEDTGLGIPMQEQEKLFTRFFRGSASRKMGNPGTGLGLAICKEILDRHGGRITVQSRPAQGSIFTVWLPSASAPAQMGFDFDPRIENQPSREEPSPSAL